MAARLNTRQSETTRAHIKTNRIVEELQKYFHGDSEKTAGQLRAAEILLNKSLPNLSATELDLGDSELKVLMVSQGNGNKPADD